MGKKYLQELEYKTYRWVHILTDKLIRLKQNKIVNKQVQGYKINNSSLIEIHMNKANILQESANTSDTKLSRRTPVRMPPYQAPLFIFGQDECIYKQFTLHSKQWVAPDGKRTILPKNDGIGIMIWGLYHKCLDLDSVILQIKNG